ncbi:asparagine-linked glycosylation protein [Umbelopsis sp. WA50703]
MADLLLNPITLTFLLVLFVSASFTFTTIVLWIVIAYFKSNLRATYFEHRDQTLTRINYTQNEVPVLLGFFHPYCNAGGGGERVLWTAIRDVQRFFPYVVSVIYTGESNTSKEEILAKVKANFDISIDANSVVFVFLRKRYLVEDDRYPRLTLLGQSLGSLFLGYEALEHVVPDVFFDTMGYAFTYPLVYLLTGIKVAAYVHYPTISSDMLNKVKAQTSSLREERVYGKNTIWNMGKLVYYRLFAKLYGYCGNFADIVMVNSTWTKGHIESLWKRDADIVYPPCDTERFSELDIKERERIIVSVAQFRPEKDHMLQLQSFAKLLNDNPDLREGKKETKLVLIGSARNEGDEKRIQSLRLAAKELNIEDNVVFEINASFSKLLDWMGRAKVGLHTMWNEHFGIGVVEYMAAGLIPVAHKSGGPLMDIVTDYNNEPTGFLAANVHEFAAHLKTAIELSPQEYKKIAVNARASVCDKFSELVFGDGVLRSLRRCLT